MVETRNILHENVYQVYSVIWGKKLSVCMKGVVRWKSINQPEGSTNDFELGRRRKVRSARCSRNTSDQAFVDIEKRGDVGEPRIFASYGSSIPVQLEFSKSRSS